MESLGWRLLGFSLWFLNVLSLYFLARALDMGRRSSVFASFLFASAFAGSEVTLWLSSVGDLFAGIFILCVFGSYFRYRRDGRASWMLAAVLLSLLGIFTKEFILLVAPLLLFARLYLGPAKRGSSKTNATEWLGVGFIVFVYGVATILLARGISAAEGSARLDVSILGPHLIRNTLDYLFSMVWPYLSFGSVFEAKHQTPSILLLAPARLLTLTAFAAATAYFLIKKRDRLGVFLLLWLALMAVLPAIFPGPIVNRYAFHCVAPFSILVARGCAGGFRKRSAIKALAAGVSILAVAGLVTRSFSIEARDKIRESRRALRGFESVRSTIAPQRLLAPPAVKNFPRIYFENSKRDTIRTFLAGALNMPELTLSSIEETTQPGDLPPGTLLLVFSDEGTVTALESTASR